MDIVFVRHGTTECNKNGIFAGKLDLPLSKEGVEEITMLKESLKDEAFDKVYVSPLKRTGQTAEILGLKGICDNRIREVDFGLFDGLTYLEIEKKYPEDCKKWKDDYVNFTFPQGEGLKELYLRTCDFIDDISKNNEKVLVVTHGGVIQCALCSVFERMDYFFRFKIEHGKINTINVKDGFKYIKTLNK